MVPGTTGWRYGVALSRVSNGNPIWQVKFRGFEMGLYSVAGNVRRYSIEAED